MIPRPSFDVVTPVQAQTPVHRPIQNQFSNGIHVPARLHIGLQVIVALTFQSGKSVFIRKLITSLRKDTNSDISQI